MMMRRPDILFMLAAGVMLAGSSTVSAQTRRDVRVSMGDGVTLDATYFLPPGVDATSPNDIPALIFVHGFAMDKEETMPSARIYAAMGMVTFTYSVRGHGNSGGRSTIMGSRERQDLQRIVEYVRAIPQVDGERVGLTGGSQGGLHALWAATDHLPLRALSADVIGPHWASDMLVNGAYRTTLCYLLSAYTVDYDTTVRDLLLDDLWGDDYESFSSRFAGPRDLDDGEFRHSRTPMILFGKWQDHYFRANEGIVGYDLYRARRDYQKLYVGTGGHYSDDDPAEWNFQFDWITRWFRQFLLGENTGILNSADIAYAVSSLPMDTNGYFDWSRRTINAWPPSGITPVRLYLRSTGRLTPSQPFGSAGGSLSLLNDFRDTTYNCYWAFWDDFQGEWFDSSFRRQALVFTSDPLRSDVDWIGVPRMSFALRPDAEKFPVNVQVYEVDRAGGKHFVNRINYVGRGATPGVRYTATAQGNAHAHTFRAGNRIRVEVTNLDMTNRKVLGWYPFVVPVFLRSTTEIAMSGTAASYVELPLRWSSPPSSLFDTSGVVTSVPADEPTVPRGVALLQNYPNPFNGSTIISYELPERARVAVTVYNLLGEEVALLVDEDQAPGVRSVSFDSGDLASGVYVYRLRAGERTVSKKLVILK